MKVALAQINTTVGDFAGNQGRALACVRQARAQGVDLIVLQELLLSGYPPRDRLFSPGFLAAHENALKDFCREIYGITAICGALTPAQESFGLPLHNSALLINDRRIVGIHHKRLLPTYDVFDEARYFAPGQQMGLFSVAGQNLGITICEDIWNDTELWHRKLYAIDPIDELASLSPDLVVTISASPFVVGKDQVRRRLGRALVSRLKVPCVYVNQVGGDDELIFDGGSFVLDREGRLAGQARFFAEDLLLVDTEKLHPTQDPAPAELDMIYQALILGLRDYARKCGFTKAVLGLSGGVDSALVAVLAADALGPDNVIGVAMPSRYSSPESLTDASELAQRLKITLHVIPIEPAHQVFEGMLQPYFHGTEPDVAEENIQARIRSNLLMSLANKFGCLLLSTGNKSEMAVGYCTLYGDMSGGLAMISDLPKTTVYELCRWINRQGMIIQEGILTKVPSAELKPNQKDQDILPPYDILDAILQGVLEAGSSLEQIVAKGFERTVVTRVMQMIQKNEYKRRQAAPGLKITSKAFGMGRRYPLACVY